MQSSMITVKFIPPTNHKDRRIRLQTWDLSHYNGKKVCTKYIAWPSLSEKNDMANEFLATAGRKLKLQSRNDRSPDTVLMFEWSIEEMAAIFGYEKEVSHDV